MADFKDLLSELTQGNASLETVRSWVEDALEEGDATREQLSAQLDEVKGALPDDMVAALQGMIEGEPSGDSGNDGGLEFDFDLEVPAADDGDKTVVDPEMEAPSFDGELSLEEPAEPASSDSSEDTTASEDDGGQAVGQSEENPFGTIDPFATGDAPASDPNAGDRTEVMQPADSDKTEVVQKPADSDKTEVVPQAGGDKTEVVRDPDATVVGGDDPTQRPGALRGSDEEDPFAMANSTAPGGGMSSPTGTGWPTATNFQGKGSALDPDSIGPGTILKDRFELLSAIGEGGMGKVYKARDLLKVEAKDRNPYIAVKLLSGDFREHPEAFIALQRESSKAQKLAHPNITTVYDFDRDGPTVYLTMELMEGQELAQFIKKLPPGGLPTEDALGIVQQLCEGLEYAHARNLVHSDFKPGNCFYLKDGTVKILDFGIARASTTRSDAAGETTVFDPGQLGALTPAYATPEMFEGEDPAPGDDIYALACVAYELLTGKHPFNKLSSVKAMEKGLSPAPINKPGFTKRQNKALMKALAFKRADRTSSVEEFWDGVRFKKSYTLQIAAASIGFSLLIGVLAYKPVVEFIEDKQVNNIIAELDAGQRQVPEVLELIKSDELSERADQNLLDIGRETIFEYFEQRAEAAIDETQDKYDFPQALAVIQEAKQYYEDSAALLSIESDIISRRNGLISELTTDFDNYLAEDRLMPIEGEDDITDLLAKLRQADPGNPLLEDARLSQRYATLAEQAIADGEWQRAKEYLTAGLDYSATDASLLNLDDQVTRELQRQADARLVAEIKDRLNAAKGDLKTVADYATVVDDLRRLEELRPDDALLKEIVTPLRSSVSSSLQQAIAASEWRQAEGLLRTFATMFSVPELLDMRNTLSRAEVNAGYQPENLGEVLAALDERQQAMNRLLASPQYNNEWSDELLRNFKETISLLRPGNTWFDQMQTRIVDSYVDNARQLVEAERFDAATRSLQAARAFNPGLPVFDAEAEKLAAAKADFDRRQAERIRLAQINAAKNSLVAQTNANDINAAINTFEQLKQELPVDDEFITTTGPQMIADSFLRLATAQAEREEFANAVQFAQRGLEYVPGMQGLEKALSDYENLAKREQLIKGAAQATTGTIGNLPPLLREVRGLFPDDATAIQNEAMRQLADRIKRLEASDVTAANDLWDAAKRLFPGTRVIDGLSLKAPPRPSKYVPSARQAMERKQLTEAENILATARREEPGNQQVAEFARELGERQDQANVYYSSYQQLMARGQKTEAKRYLDAALSFWTDNPKYKDELAKNFTTTRAPTRSADGSRPCTASLAGFGRSGRAVCFDILSGSTRGPELVVVPAGGGISKPFAIGKYEISNGDLNAYCRASSNCPVNSDTGMPATNISLSVMQGYVNWLTQTTGKQYRLPTAAEWSYAATATNPKAVTNFNCRVTQGGQILKGLTMLEIKSGRANPWGLMNYVGNVQEVVRDGGGHAARGGAFQDNLSTCDIGLSRNFSGQASEITGFRVARETD
ncbi:MAG: protein kinase [Gammaproteobacteria bacterium]|nr:protein kinase [Gammaproteobacteria bacterium]